MSEEEKTEKTPETAVPPASPPEQPTPAKNTGESRLARFKTWYGERKKWTIPASVLLLILILAAVPFTRYNLAGLAVKKDFSVKVVDSTAGTPVSGATVSLGGVSAETDSSGKAVLHHVKPGSHPISISKKYYKDVSAPLLVPLLKQKNTPQVNLTATGRQVKVTIKNLINKNVLADVTISAAGVTAKTDKTGSATMVLPVGSQQQQAKLSLDGFNTASVSIKVSNDKIQENDFSLTPAGEVYFLSNLSGTIDVVKTNLDGTNRQTVLAGTGKEDNQNTVLLASRDWKYLALLSKRSGAQALYLIDTLNDKLSVIDSGNATFNVVGWSDDSFIYTLTRQNLQPWQPHGQALKSFNAQTKQLVTLDQTGGQGTGNNDYAQENYGQVYQIGKSVVYEKYWSAPYFNDSVLNDKQAGIYSVSATGSSAQTLKTFGYTSGQSTYINSVPYEANQIYYSVYEKGVQSYWAYIGGKVNSKNNIASNFNDYYQKPTTYLLSPSGNNTFWGDPRDGKNTLFVGDENGDSGKQIATLSDYSSYGWFTDNYLLVSKNSSELYIMPRAGGDAVKITDYHKPAIDLRGYGGGYGGL